MATNANTATREDLIALNGIGELIVDAIIYARPFKAIDDLVSIPGIGPITLESLKEQGLYVGEPPQDTPSRDEHKTWVVRGLVVGEDGDLLDGITVQAYAKKLRDETLLGKAKSDKQGKYIIRYCADEYGEKGRGIDLVVRAYNRRGREIVSSPIVFKAGPEETIDLVQGGGKYLGPSEFETLKATLSPLIGDIPLAELTEDETHSDLTYLSGDTGIAAQQIALLVKAHRLEAKTTIPAEVFYGLFREGVSAQLPALLAQSPDILQRALTRAAGANLVSSRMSKDAKGMVERLGQVALKLASEETPAQSGRASLVSLVAAVFPKVEERASVLKAYASDTTEGKGFWDELQKSFPDRVDELRFTLQAGALTDSRLPLVQQILRMKRSGELNALNDVAHLNEKAWENMIGQAAAEAGDSFLDGIPGNNDAERFHHYAVAITHLVEDSFTTTFVTSRLAEDDLPGKDDLVVFLRRNPDFQLKADRLDSYLAKKPDAMLGVSNEAETSVRIKALQRVYRVAPRYQQAAAILKDGIDSAHAISRISKNAFLSTYSAKFGGVAQAADVYERAGQMHAMATNLLAEYSPVFGRVPTRAVSDEAVTNVTNTPEWATLFGSLDFCSCEHCRSVYSPAAYFVDILNFLRGRKAKAGNAKHVLFQRRPDLGEMELTCQNINLALPYVDLVNEVMEDAVAPPSVFTPFVLASRLEGTLNSCKMTTALQNAFNPPLTENAVITLSEPGASGETWWTIDDLAFTYAVQKKSGSLQVESRSRQTKGSAAERAANPQYVNPDAYKTLNKAVYPWSLPFDLWTEEARAYLSHLGVPLYEVMEAFLPSNRKTVLTDPRVVNEYLGLTEAEAKIITGKTTAQAGATSPGVWNLWGFASQNLSQGSIPDPANSTSFISSGNWLNILGGRVDVFLQQSGLTYKELLDLLECYYVNPVDTSGAGSGAPQIKRTISIDSTDLANPETCDKSKLKLQGMDLAAAGRIVRFVRLWTRLGWTMRDLDRAITAFGTADITEDLLIKLSHIQRLANRSGIPIINLLSWWTPIDTAFYVDRNAAGQPRLPSLYEQLFRNRAVINPLDPVFVENPLALSGKLSDSATAIASALGISSADLSLFMADKNVLPDDTLSLDNLSWLARHAGLAKALKFTARQYLSTLQLIDPKPFSSTVATVIFVETTQQMEASGFTTVELDYLLRHNYAASSGVAPTQEAVATILGDIRSGLQKIAGENTFRATSNGPDGTTTDPGGDLTRQKLALLDWDAALIDEIIATLNGKTIYETALSTLPAGLTLPNDTGSYEVVLAALPSSFSFPASLSGAVSYDATSTKLKASRILDPPERTSLSKAAQGESTLMTAVEALFTLQDEVQGKISFDSTRGKLRFTGPMTQARRTRLKAAVPTSTDPACVLYLTAIDKLFDAPRQFVGHNLRTLTVHDFSTPLASLPAMVKFPAVLKDKVYHDTSTSAPELHFIGPMSISEKETLLAMAADSTDPSYAAYQTAIKTLYAAPDNLTPDPSDAFLTYSGTDNDAGKMFDKPVTPESRFLLVLQKLLPYLKKTLSQGLVKQKMTEALGLEAKATEKIMSLWVASPGDPQPTPSLKRRILADFLSSAFAESNTNVTPTPKAFPDQFRSFTLLNKLAILAGKWSLTSKQLGWLFTQSSAAGWLDPSTLQTQSTDTAASFQGWLHLVNLFVLRDNLPRGETTLAGIFELAGTTGTTALDMTKYLSSNIQWDLTDLNYLAGAQGFNLTLPDAIKDERALVRLRHCFDLLKRLGMSASLCRDLAGGTVTETMARRVVMAVRAKYDESQWLSLARPLRNVLREKQRAALVSHLVVNPNKSKGQEWRDVNDVFAHFLIDVEMSPCMLTSRCKQAISTAQLFVQRCLLNLESDIVADASADNAWRWWSWMRNYRVWEANRKVFLYPENWIEPELRDDKSPFFKELESELMQGDLTEEAAEAAFIGYLNKLDEVARLEVVGTFHQYEVGTSGSTNIDILHVFARTYGNPHTYYYRQRVDASEWTAWERVEVDIEGDHLLPVLWNRRLYIFWPVFTEKADPASNTLPPANQPFNEPMKYWEIKLAWSERKAGKWSAKKTSSGSVRDWYDKIANYYLRSNFSGDQLEILLSHSLTFDGVTYYGPWKYVFDPSRPDPTSWLGYVTTPIPMPTGTIKDYMFFKENTENALYLPVSHSSSSDTQDIKALNTTPGTYRVLPHSDGTDLPEYPFFFLDDQRTFVVIPSKSLGKTFTDVQWLNPGYTDSYFDWTKVRPCLPDLSTPLLYEQSFPAFAGKGPGVQGPTSIPGGVGDIGHLQALNNGGVIPGLLITSPQFATGNVLIPKITGNGKDMLSDTSAMPVSIESFLPVAEAWTPTGFAGAGVLDTVIGNIVICKSFLFESRYTFYSFYHPYVKAFIRELNRDGVKALFQREVQTKPYLFLPRQASGGKAEPLDFKKTYEPHKVAKPIVLEPYPQEEVDFITDGSYSLYNWELFFHAPLLIADRLSQNQRYEEARKWFHYIFDPTDTSSDTEVPRRFWRTKPFHLRTRDGYRRENIEYSMKLLAAGGDSALKSKLTAQQLRDLKDLEGSVAKWRKYPFKPHVIARLRTTAYQKTVIMKYIENLIAWGDQLFRRDTIETINEATQLYVLAAEILGRRPEEIPVRISSRAQTYNALESKLDAFSNALEELVPAPSLADTGTASPDAPPPLTLPGILHFCVPKNDNLLHYWDTVADRLFKLRHCMNIEGVVRQLPLFEPPIDPAMLVRAAAAGIDLGSVLGDAAAALPYYRFRILIQKAGELCGDVKALGSALLAALEKKDAEKLALVRAQHETAMLKRVEEVKKQQLKEAEASLSSLETGRTLAVTRYLHYQKLLGVESPQTPTKGEVVPDYAPSSQAAVKDEAGVKMLALEKEEMDKLAEANRHQEKASSYEIQASIAHVIPNWNIEPWGVGATFGGQNVGSSLSAFAGISRSKANDASYKAGKAGKTAGHIMRAHEWGLQSNMAAKEVMQTDKQILAAEIRKEIAQRELTNHQKQMEESATVEEFMRSKYTNQELYSWMVGQIAGVYFQSYQLAYDLAKRAERSYRYELGLRDSSFIKFGYWDNLKRGLLAGDKLHADLRRLELAYLDQNRREYEITKHVSLAQLDPMALIRLKQTGEAYVSLPEVLFDLDCPGHFLRRIKAVSLSIPCVVGPYTSLNCTLTLLKSTVRHSNTLLGGKYARQEEDRRFMDSNGVIASVVTSSGQNDSGLFETNLQDERYLPFEGAGVTSFWHLQLPRDFRSFNYDTISDVVMHLRYTARDGGAPLQQQARADLKEAITEITDSEDGTGLSRLFSLRHEFPTEWHNFLNRPNGSTGDQSITLDLSQSRFPYMFQAKTIKISSIEAYVKVASAYTSTYNQSKLKLSLACGTATSTTALSFAIWNNLLQAKLTPSGSASPGQWTLAAWYDLGSGTHEKLIPEALEDIFLICKYTVS